jgi:hypothetical protein
MVILLASIMSVLIALITLAALALVIAHVNFDEAATQPVPVRVEAQRRRANAR